MVTLRVLVLYILFLHIGEVWFGLRTHTLKPLLIRKQIRLLL